MTWQPGIVFLVGAGPGDPDLITVRGRRLLEQATSEMPDNVEHPLANALSRNRVIAGLYTIS